MQCERKPLPVALFCGASIESLLELAEFVECGVPVLVIQVGNFRKIEIKEFVIYFIKQKFYQLNQNDDCKKTIRSF
jgi:hypothetical protein